MKTATTNFHNGTGSTGYKGVGPGLAADVIEKYIYYTVVVPSLAAPLSKKVQQLTRYSGVDLGLAAHVGEKCSNSVAWFC